MKMGGNLPEFEDPPVVEVALAVQFETLTSLRTPQLGLLWQRFRDRFPKIEEHAPLESIKERFDVKRTSKPLMRFEMMEKLPVPRCWFLNDAGTELIQVQQDRFARNWRKITGVENYPRFEKHIRPSFKQDLLDFQQFIHDEKIGQLQPNQCEVTYVNHIEVGDRGDEHGDIGRIVTLFNTKYTEKFLPDLEQGRISGAYIIPNNEGKPLGRLHFSVMCAYRHDTDIPILVVNLVARGSPDGKGVGGIMAFLDTGREWIVRGFAAITTPEMHKIWRRKK